MRQAFEAVRSVERGTDTAPALERAAIAAGVWLIFSAAAQSVSVCSVYLTGVFCPRYQRVRMRGFYLTARRAPRFIQGLFSRWCRRGRLAAWTTGKRSESAGASEARLVPAGARRRGSRDDSYSQNSNAWNNLRELARSRLLAAAEDPIVRYFLLDRDVRHAGFPARKAGMVAVFRLYQGTGARPVLDTAYRRIVHPDVTVTRCGEQVRSNLHRPSAVLSPRAYMMLNLLSGGHTCLMDRVADYGRCLPGDTLHKRLNAHLAQLLAQPLGPPQRNPVVPGSPGLESATFGCGLPSAA